MSFEEHLDQAIAMLRRRSRVPYRPLKLQFNSLARLRQRILL